MTPRLELIVAHAKNGVIGKNGTMPWHLSEDLKHFKAVTMGCPVIMGRKTHESIGRPLPGRRNIVISRNPDFVAEKCEVVNSLEDALALLSDAPKAFVIGGAQIYKKAIDLCQSAWVTEIDLAVEGDAFFPALDSNTWERHELRTVEATDTTPKLVFCRFDRKA